MDAFIVKRAYGEILYHDGPMVKDCNLDIYRFCICEIYIPIYR